MEPEKEADSRPLTPAEAGFALATECRRMLGISGDPTSDDVTRLVELIKVPVRIETYSGPTYAARGPGGAVVTLSRYAGAAERDETLVRVAASFLISSDHWEVTLSHPTMPVERLEIYRPIISYFVAGWYRREPNLENDYP